MAQNGFRNLLWFMGVVEDRKDPRKMGRVRVRAFDIHPDDKNEVPTEDLPWAIPVIGTYHTDFKPPIEGSWVFGFFIDGADAQHPMLLGIMPGMPTGYSDSFQAYNGFDVNPAPCDIYQPDIPRLARGENIEETNVASRFINQEKGEPPPAYNTEYPYSRVQQTESGHIFEMDDTPASERINIAHRSGTFVEMLPNGGQVNKVVGSKWEIIEGDDSLYIKGNGKINVKGRIDIKVEGAANLEVDGTLHQTIHGDHILNVAGEMQVNVGQGYRVKASSIRQEAYLDSIDTYAKHFNRMEAGQGISLHANTANVKLYAKEDVRIEANTYGLYTRGDSFTYTTGNTNFIADGNTHIQAVRVDINTDGKAESHQYDNGKSIPNDVYGDQTLIVNRTLLGEPTVKKFPNEITTQVDEYSIFTDVEPDQDTHTLEV